MNGDRAVQADAPLCFGGEVDRIYVGTPDAVQLRDAGRMITSDQLGFPDTVVWNPGAQKAALLSDLTPGAHASFVCMEAAAVELGIALAPGESWRGEQILTLHGDEAPQR